MTTLINNNSKGMWKTLKGRARSQPKGRQATDEALSQIQKLLSEQPRNRDLLVEFLHLIQDQFGHITSAHLCALAQEMNLSQAEVYEVVTFYAHFDVVHEGELPPPPLTIRVCDSLSCELAGSQNLLRALDEKYTGAKKVRVVRAPCMGRCDTAPVVELGHKHIDNVTLDKVTTAILTLDTKADIPDYQTFTDYCKSGGYKALKSFQDGEQTSDQIQETLLASGLRGLGGAGFPSGRKWAYVRAEPGPRYLAVNGDEGEPGTFKDRYYLEREPHLMLEGMLIAGHAIEADKIFIYMRDEYPAVLEILRREIASLEAAKIIEPGFVSLRRGAGAYICGEESAMIESIEGKRGMPRHRPPFAAQVGIFNRPTLVHNVETLHWVARICREGPQILNSVTKNDRIGLRSYSVSGRVKQPGVKLLPVGSTISDVIQASGGMLERASVFCIPTRRPLFRFASSFAK